MWDNSFYIILDGRQDVNKGAKKRPHRPLVFASCGREGSRTPSEQAHAQIRPIQFFLPKAQVPFGNLGFGTFSAQAKAAKTGRNPRTGEVVTVPAKTVPVFKAGKAFKEKVILNPL